MKRFSYGVILAIATAVGSASSAQVRTDVRDGADTRFANNMDTSDVQHVIDAYHEAVVTHDGPRLASLFLPEGSLWLNVLSDEAFLQAKTKVPSSVKIRSGSYTDFAKLVSSGKAELNPTHTNLQVKSDGVIASVYFDFVFLADGKEQNRGSETWIMVKGSEGWRIAAITYSSSPRKP